MLETKKLTCLTVNSQDDILAKFSSFIKLKRNIAYCCRFLTEYRQYKGSLSIIELKHVETIAIRVVQNKCFQTEIKNLSENKSLNTKSKIYNLDPIVGDDGLLRVGGRLKNADISFDKKHPIILPKSNFLTDLIISHYHIVSYHGGQQATLYNMRQKYWPVDGRNQIKKNIRKCIHCFRTKPKLVEYKMGNLPETRVTQTRPFNRVGIDYCGPFFIKERKYRNKKKIKVYVCIFV